VHLITNALDADGLEALDTPKPAGELFTTLSTLEDPPFIGEYRV
jgi:hypothetical protein